MHNIRRYKVEELQNVDIYPTINRIMDGNGVVTYIISGNDVYTSGFIDYEKIPYLMDADRESMKYNTYLDRVIIVFLQGRFICQTELMKMILITPMTKKLARTFVLRYRSLGL